VRRCEREAGAAKTDAIQFRDAAGPVRRRGRDGPQNIFASVSIRPVPVRRHYKSAASPHPKTRPVALCR
jgi:hypothetical protein